MSQPLPPELLEARPALAVDPDPELLHPATSAPPLGLPPRKYTQAVHDVIVEQLKKGQRPQGACAKAGITVATFHEWIRKGKAGDPFLVQFAEDVEIAYNLAEQRAVEVVNEAYDNDDPDQRDVEQAKWFLERARPDGYSKQVKTAVEVQIKDFLLRLEQALPPRLFEQVLAVYLGQAPDAAALLPENVTDEAEPGSS